MVRRLVLQQSSRCSAPFAATTTRLDGQSSLVCARMEYRMPLNVLNWCDLIKIFYYRSKFCACLHTQAHKHTRVIISISVIAIANVFAAAPSIKIHCNSFEYTCMCSVSADIISVTNSSWCCKRYTECWLLRRSSVICAAPSVTRSLKSLLMIDQWSNCRCDALLLYSILFH